MRRCVSDSQNRGGRRRAGGRMCYIQGTIGERRGRACRRNRRAEQQRGTAPACQNKARTGQEGCGAAAGDFATGVRLRSLHSAALTGHAPAATAFGRCQCLIRHETRHHRSNQYHQQQRGRDGTQKRHPQLVYVVARCGTTLEPSSCKRSMFIRGSRPATRVPAALDGTACIRRSWISKSM